MIGSKLHLMLQQLSKREFRRFVEFVHSPYFNKHDRLKDLTDYLYVHLPENNLEALEKNALFEHLFPNEGYNEQRLADLMSYLVKLLEQFLVQLNLERNAFQEELGLMEELAQRDLHKPFQRQARRLRNQQKKEKNRDENYYLQEYLFWNASDSYFMRQQKRTKDESLQQKVDALDLFYLSAKLKNACEMVNRSHVISETYHFWLTDEVLSYLRNNIDDYAEHPSIVVYFHILSILTEPDEESHFTKLKAVLAENMGKFRREETRYMYLYMQNYIIYRINKGDQRYLPELFNLYKWLLETEIILEGNYLSQWDYKNIVSAGYRMEAYHWTEQFIHNYRDKLRPEEQENAYNYNLAMLYYYKGEFKRALRLLQTVDFTDLYYALGARSILMKSYYDLEDWDPLYSLFDSFSVYLKRNKQISGYQQEIHLNFIRITRKLAGLRIKQIANNNEITVDQLEKVLHKMEQNRQIAHYTWLYKRLKRLANTSGLSLESDRAQASAGGSH